MAIASLAPPSERIPHQNGLRFAAAHAVKPPEPPAIICDPSSAGWMPSNPIVSRMLKVSPAAGADPNALAQVSDVAVLSLMTHVEPASAPLVMDTTYPARAWTV